MFRLRYETGRYAAIARQNSRLSARHSTRKRCRLTGPIVASLEFIGGAHANGVESWLLLAGQPRKCHHRIVPIVPKVGISIFGAHQKILSNGHFYAGACGPAGADRRRRLGAPYDEIVIRVAYVS